MVKSILNQLLFKPGSAKSLSVAQWDLCLRQAKTASLLGRLYYILEQHDNLQYLPPRALNHLNAALLRSHKQHQDINPRLSGYLVN